MGVTTVKEGARSLTSRSRIMVLRQKGRQKKDGAYTDHVYGTYVHGVFEKEEVPKAVIRAIGREKGLDVSEITSVDFAQFKETQYDLLAAGLREHLDMKKIYEILEEGI